MIKQAVFKEVNAYLISLLGVPIIAVDNNNDTDKGLINGKVTNIEFRDNFGICIVCELDRFVSGSISADGDGYVFPLDALGSILFLSRADAELSLKLLRAVNEECLKTRLAPEDYALA